MGFGTGHNYIGHNYIGHNYIGHHYIGHNYKGQNYIGHDYIERALWYLSDSAQAPRRSSLARLRDTFKQNALASDEHSSTINFLDIATSHDGFHVSGNFFIFHFSSPTAGAEDRANPKVAPRAPVPTPPLGIDMRRLDMRRWDLFLAMFRRMPTANAEG